MTSGEGNSSVKYAHGHHASVLRGHGRRSVSDSASYLVPFLSPGLKILDVGCGPGSITRDLLSYVPGGSIIGIDRSEAVITKAASQVIDGTDCTFLVRDAFATGFDDESFDVVHAHQVLQHVERPDDLLREMVRVLKKDGILAVREADFGRFSWRPESADLDRWMTMYRTIARDCGGNPDAGRALEPMVREEKLEILVSQDSSWDYRSVEEVVEWSSMWADRVVASDFATHARRLGLTDDEGLATLHDGWLAWSRLPGAEFIATHHEVVARK